MSSIGTFETRRLYDSVLRLTATCPVRYLTLACLSCKWQCQIYLPLVCYPQIFDYVSFLSSAACFASRTACYYEDCLLYPIKGKKGEVLPLEFTYSECQCQKSAVFSTSIRRVTDVKVTWRPYSKFCCHFVTPSDLRELYHMIWYMLYMIWYMMYDMIWYDMMYDMIYDMIWYDTVRYDTIRYDTMYDIRYIMIYDTWCDMIWYDMIWYDMIWYMIRYDIFNCNLVVTRWQ